MKLIVGLGNPGEKYESTRHNLGFMIIDHLLKDLQPVNKSNWDKNEKLKSEVFIFDYNMNGEAEKVILAKPLTFMNNSGMAVSLIAKYYKVKPEDIWLIYDELDLPLGSMKIRQGGGAAGHHGVESIMNNLKTDKFWRFRMGIGQSAPRFKVQGSKLKNVSDFVLDGFGRGDQGKAKTMIKKGSKALSVALEKGILASQNQFNTK